MRAQTVSSEDATHLLVMPLMSLWRPFGESDAQACLSTFLCVSGHLGHLPASFARADPASGGRQAMWEAGAGPRHDPGGGRCSGHGDPAAYTGTIFLQIIGLCGNRNQSRPDASSPATWVQLFRPDNARLERARRNSSKGPSSHRKRDGLYYW